MKTSLKFRRAIPEARRLVVKVGTGVLVQKTGRPDIRCMRRLVRDLARLRRAGYEVVLVTSGAIGAGTERLGMRERPTDVADLQMAAAVGQARLMSTYDALFSAAGYTVGQILLTHADFHHKIRMSNASRTIKNLLRHSVIPIINENDVVADEEIKADLALGDNDYLASLVVKLVRAELLIILSTTDGVRDFGNGRSTRVHYIESITRKTFALVTHGASRLSKGGMDSKLRAAQSAASAGCATVIANGRETGVLERIMRGEDVGTLVLPSAV
jgi:glutamate 5-kinase